MSLGEEVEKDHVHNPEDFGVWRRRNRQHTSIHLTGGRRLHTLRGRKLLDIGYDAE